MSNFVVGVLVGYVVVDLSWHLLRPLFYKLLTRRAARRLRKEITHG